MSQESNQTDMSINEYQRKASKTNQISNNPSANIMNSISNLTEEVGSLLRWYQQDLYSEAKANEDLTLFKKKARSKLGDILWYVSNIAEEIEVNLGDIANENIKKIEMRWPKSNAYCLYDDDFVREEQLPREFKFCIKETPDTGKVKLIAVLGGDAFLQLGNIVNDNADIADDYRFHDVFHIAYAAYLGWSPVLRALLRRKRKSDPLIDRAEDGARAIALEEGLTALIFEYAKGSDFFKDHSKVDFKLIKLAERLTLTKEVSSRSPLHWEDAILNGYRVFRELQQNRSGIITMNLIEREISYKKLTDQDEAIFRK